MESSNHVKNVSVNGNRLSFSIDDMAVWDNKVKIEMYYAVKVDADVDAAISENDRTFVNNCSGTITSSDGSKTTETDSSSVTVTKPSMSKTAGSFDKNTKSIEYTVNINEDGKMLGTTGTVTVVDTYDYSSAASIDNVYLKSDSLQLVYADTGRNVPSNLYSYTYVDDNSAKKSTLTPMCLILQN